MTNITEKLIENKRSHRINMPRKVVGITIFTIT